MFSNAKCHFTATGAHSIKAFFIVAYLFCSIYISPYQSYRADAGADNAVGKMDFVFIHICSLRLGDAMSRAVPGGVRVVGSENLKTKTTRFEFLC